MAARAKDIVRVGDRVRLVVPKIVLRVGYPKCVEDFIPEARELIGSQLQAAGIREIYVKDTNKSACPILRELAYALLKKNGFGGRQRSVHFRDVENWDNFEFTVYNIRSVQSGTYYPASGGAGRTYDGDYEDYDPAGLALDKVHRLCALKREGEWGMIPNQWSGSGGTWRPINGKGIIEAPTYHLEKIQ